MRDQRVEQDFFFKLIALARNQQRALYRPATDDDRHAAAVFKLPFQRFGHSADAAADVNRIKRRARGRLGQPVVLHIIDIVQSQAIQHCFGTVLLLGIEVV